MLVLVFPLEIICYFELMIYLFIIFESFCPSHTHHRLGRGWGHPVKKVNDSSQVLSSGPANRILQYFETI